MVKVLADQRVLSRVPLDVQKDAEGRSGGYGVTPNALVNEAVPMNKALVGRYIASGPGAYEIDLGAAKKALRHGASGPELPRRGV